MDLSTLEIPEDEATAKLAEYEQMLAGERTAEDEAIAAAYRAAARGLPVISLTATIAAGGWFDNGLPRIAVINADAQTCFARWEPGWRGRDSLIFAITPDWHANRGALVGVSSVRVPVAEPPTARGYRGQAPVPLIPPSHRPRPRRLRHCHILWEVEEWGPVVARDPALLRYIRGDLWSVLATWDLTPLERLVLSQRAVQT